MEAQSAEMEYVTGAGLAPSLGRLIDERRKCTATQRTSGLLIPKQRD